MSRSNKKKTKIIFCTLKRRTSLPSCLCCRGAFEHQPPWAALEKSTHSTTIHPSFPGKRLLIIDSNAISSPPLQTDVPWSSIPMRSHALATVFFHACALFSRYFYLFSSYKLCQLFALIAKGTFSVLGFPFLLLFNAIVKRARERNSLSCQQPKSPEVEALSCNVIFNWNENVGEFESD